MPDIKSVKSFVPFNADGKSNLTELVSSVVFNSNSTFFNVTELSGIIQETNALDSVFSEIEMSPGAGTIIKNRLE